MLPESQFPVTGGIMQTEEVVPCAQSTGLDELATTERLHSLQQQQSASPLLFCPAPPQAPSSVQQLHHLPYAPLVSSMAVKQEPQEHEDERARQSGTLCASTEHEDAQVEQHKCQSAAASGQSSPEFEVPPVVQPGAACQQNGCKKPASVGVPGNAPPWQTTYTQQPPHYSRIRRKSRWKLKFHHQALPPEYLDHYEAALAQEAALSSSATPTSPLPAPQPQPPPPPPPPANVDVQSWLQRLAAMQSEFYAAPAPPPSQPQLAASRRSVITSTQHMQHQQQQQQQQPRPPMKYSDLPYMGEITLDNCKPRRGRKPKKADICHLIYKNYGTILPGTPGLEDRSKLPQERLDVVGGKEPAATVSAFQRTDIQNRISSLLEKRLTQERRALESAVEQQEEPMNLCIRDLNLLKIRLGDRQPSAFGSCHSRSDGSSDAEDVEFLGPSMAEHDQEDQSKGGESNGQLFGSNDNSESNGLDDSTSKPSPNLMYWPNNNVFLHPVALQSQFMYYQKLAQDKGQNPELPKEQQQRIVPKSIYSMLESHKPAASEPTAPEPSTPSPRPKRNSSSSQSQPTKRKRSAIFIPPMPTENNNNPATEVSICKFKFTGGAKPSLQEKKSLSVDSGGNFRYYSGTGDKSMRGYEFFPREALQQPANQPTNNSTGAFLNAAAERSQPAATPCPPRPVSACSTDDSRNRKRKTRKSMQREKLEQTFKEKGFLIQTQQLESAEGATYCKFRQLRKFTRYLFRSWKDYLPGELTESEAQAAAAAGELQHSSYVEPSVN